MCVHRGKPPELLPSVSSVWVMKAGGCRQMCRLSAGLDISAVFIFSRAC